MAGWLHLRPASSDRHSADDFFHELTFNYLFIYSRRVTTVRSTLGGTKKGGRKFLLTQLFQVVSVLEQSLPVGFVRFEAEIPLSRLGKTAAINFIFNTYFSLDLVVIKRNKKQYNCINNHI